MFYGCYFLKEKKRKEILVMEMLIKLGYGLPASLFSIYLSILGLNFSFQYSSSIFLLRYILFFVQN
jgi:hypothetical protein